MNHLNVQIVADAKEAIQQGHFYRPPVFLPIKIDKIVVVKNGTVEGNATCDIVLEDEKGQKYVVMTTLALLEGVVAAGVAE